MDKTRATSVRIEHRNTHACHRQPTFVDDLISYDVISPLAAKRLLSAIGTQPDTRWIVPRLRVQHPVAAKRLPMKTSRGHKRALVLRDVAYTLDADFVSAISDNVMPKQDDVLRRAPLGAHRFQCQRILVTSSDPPATAYAVTGKIDVGWMIHDLDGRGRSRARYFRAEMINGPIELDRSRPLELIS